MSNQPAQEPAQPTVLQRFSAHVTESGHRPFLYHGDSGQRFTFTEFNVHTNRLAGALKNVGAVVSSRLAVFARSALLYAGAMLASWKCASVYCPINAQFSAAFCRQTLEDLQPAILLVDDALFSTVLEALQEAQLEAPIHIILVADNPATCPPNSIKGVIFHQLQALLDGNNPIPAPIVNSSAPASIVYTSGTTSQPKGVIHSHGWATQVAQTLAAMTHRDDVLHCDIPLYHIGGAYMNIVRAAWSGASVALWDKFSASQYWTRIANSGASIAILLDVMIDWMLAQPAAPSDHKNTLIRAHMQPLRSNYEEVARRFGIDFIAVGYGSTELGIVFTGLIDIFETELGGTPCALWKGYSKEELRSKVSALAGESAIAASSQHVPEGFMGSPVATFDIDLRGNTQTEAQHGQLTVKPHAPGALFGGYLNKPDITKRAIQDGWYLTPDHVSLDQEERYRFMGRSEGFIRTRGENISAQGLEEAVKAHGDIAACAAVAVHPVEGNEDAIAIFVEFKAGASIAEDRLRTWMQKHLPKFMQPHYLRIVKALPLTATMKVAKAELRLQLHEELKRTHEKDAILG